MASLDDLVDRLLVQQTQREASENAAGLKSAASAGAASGAASQVGDSFEQLIKNASAAVSEKDLAEKDAEIKRLNDELQQARAELASRVNAPSAHASAASSPEPSPVPAGDASGAPTTISGATFPWKKHITIVEDALRKKTIATAEPVIKVLIDVAEIVTVDIPVRVRLMTQLGTIDIERGKFAEAEETLKKAIGIARSVESVTQADAVSRAFCLDALAQCYQEREDFENAEKLRRQAVVLAEEALGGEHPDVGFFRERQESMRQQRQLAMIGKDEASKTLYDKYTEAYNAAVEAGEPPAKPQDATPDGYSTLMFEKFYNMGKNALTQKNTREAETSFRSATEKSAGVSGTDPRKCEAFRLLGQALEAQGNKENEARQNYELALDVALKFLGFNDPQIPECLGALASVHAKLNDVGLAKNYYKQAVTASVAIFGKDDPKSQLAQQRYDDFVDQLKSENTWKGWTQ